MNKMIKLTVFVAVAAAVTGAFAGETASKFRPSEKYILIENHCLDVSTNCTEAMKMQLKSGLHFPARIVNVNDGAKCTGGKCCAAAKPADADAAFTIVIQDKPECDIKMMCAPEDGKVVVNIAPLKADKPDAKKLDQRVLKLMWRGFAFANGAGYTRMPPCLLKPTDGSLKSIDNLGSCCPCPEAFNNLMRGCAARGLGPTAASATDEDEE